MKLFFYLTITVFILQGCSSNQSIIELDSNQSMCITGKGIGQDAAINPYANSTSLAIIENLSNEAFSARIQSRGDLIDEIIIPPKSKKEVILQVDYELYLDSTAETKAKIKFKKYKE